MSLNIKDRFREYWDHPTFFMKAGLAEQAVDSQLRVSKSLIQHAGRKCRPIPGCVCCAYHDWLSRAGDLFWAAGNVDQARKHYQRCIDEAGGREFVLAAGLGGFTRLYFYHGEYAECIAMFRRSCPPHDFYVQQNLLDSQLDANANGRQRAQARDDLVSRFPGTAPYFLSKAKYMCRAIVFAGLRAGGIDANLRGMLIEYFNITSSQLDDLIKALNINDAVIEPLRKRVAPKAAVVDHTFDRLLADGDTELARRVRDRLPQCNEYVGSTTKLLEEFLQCGDATLLDEMLAAGSPFGIAPADALIIEEALNSRTDQIARVPLLHLALLRKFSPICQYPKYDFLADYLEVVQQTNADIKATDVISAILDLQWYKTPYSIDDTSIGGTKSGFGKTEISDNREWLEVVLQDYPPIYNRACLSNRDEAIGALHRAYQFLRNRFNEVRHEDRWVKESQLGDALAALFGRTEVHRHARPLWLSPQHLDYFLPRYNLAIEYMGLQHYQSVEIFGGEGALQETQLRDKRKLALCQRMGITMVYVTYQDDVGKSAREIYNRFKGYG
ncbi:MAG: hypothetical protein IT445_04565 [Phycisphaeraceae bacterium]|nr:hypothetical protein [Phycisphaeraceae bacterium]